ncbi:MAG: A/G-specific adenine glycosylase [Flavobacteriaceae bacterium]|nr:A/G-specific adenine glycosylase [Flavobacteriaceae bacterium]
MEFSNKLIIWYLKNKRILPWREDQNPYYIWLSEIMLQQTRVDQSLPYFLKYIDTFPAIQDLADADENEVLKLWQGLGYYSRARNLLFTAKYISTGLNGQFPNSYKELLKLKGIGDYTAAAISSICFNEPKAVVDGNVYRVLSRYFDIDIPINSSKGIAAFKELAQELISIDKPGDYNQAIMELGATVCKPQNPNCEDCVLNDACLALKNNKQKLLPVKKNKAKIKTIHLNYLVVVSENKKTIVEKRKGKGIWQHLYQFPLIESHQEMNQEEIISNPLFVSMFNEFEINIRLHNDVPIQHKLTHRHLLAKFWIIKVPKLEQFTTEWKKMNEFPVPILIANFLKQFKID